MPQHTRDLIVGLFVASGLGVIAFLSLNVGGAQLGGRDTFTIYATFDEIGGLTTRSPVVIGGVKVGSVDTIRLNENFEAVVGLSVQENLKLPKDTSASILTAGVLGNQYVGLLPGADETILTDGEFLGLTEDAVVLERLIGRLIQNLGVD